MHYTTSLSFFLLPQMTTQIISAISEHKLQENSNTFGDYLSAAGVQHGNMHQLSVTMSNVTYFILLAHTGTGVSHAQPTQEKLGRGFRKNAGEWTGRV